MSEVIDLADLAPFGLLHLDSRRRVTAANQMAQSVLRHSERSMVRKPLSEVLFYDSPIFELIDKAIGQGRTVNATNIPLNGPGFQSAVMLDLRLQPAGRDGVIIAFSPSNRTETFDKTQGVSAFGRILGHEVKNPLAGISGAAQLLKRRFKGQEEQLLSIILDETKRIERLVSRLSAFELFSAPQKETVNIHEVIDRVLNTEKVVFADQVAYRRDFDPSLPEIIGDQDHLHEALLNLVRNASEAANSSSDNACVTLETAFETGFAIAALGREKRLGRAIRITIKDNGPGIASEHRQTLFQPFSSTKSGGRGLGLSIVSEIVKAHNGRIQLHSVPGDTRFSLYLPIQSQAQK
ncbi:MAG: ATP-binding protein [Pseudomonadota bacterium]